MQEITSLHQIYAQEPVFGVDVSVKKEALEAAAEERGPVRKSAGAGRAGSDSSVAQAKTHRGRR